MEKIEKDINAIGTPQFLELKEGFPYVWEWAKEEHPEDQYFTYQGKVVNVAFDAIFGRPNMDTALNSFFINFKEAYFNKLYLIIDHINYFIKFYDHDRELLTSYLHIKYILDLKKTKKFKREAFIKLIMERLFTPTMCDKIRKMVDDNYVIDLTPKERSSKKKSYPEEQKFEVRHAKVLMRVSTAIKILIPMLIHYITIYFNNKKECENLHLYYLPLFETFGDGVDIIGKMYYIIYQKAMASSKQDTPIHDKQEALGESVVTLTENLLYKNIIIDNVFRYEFNGNIISFNTVLLDKQLFYFSNTDLGVDHNLISMEKDSEGLSGLDKMEIYTTKIDEFQLLFSEINIKDTVNRIKNSIKYKIDEEEYDYYLKHHKINHTSKKIMFYFYAKYFNGFRDLKLISDPRMYITLLVIMKHTLEAKGCIYLNQVITANIAGKINTRTIRNTKYLTKVRESSVHKNILKKKYSTAVEMGKSDIAIDILSAIINTRMTLVDYELQDYLGEPLEINEDILSQEVLDFVNNI